MKVFNFTLAALVIGSLISLPRLSLAMDIGGLSYGESANSEGESESVYGSMDEASQPPREFSHPYFTKPSQLDEFCHHLEFPETITQAWYQSPRLSSSYLRWALRTRIRRHKGPYNSGHVDKEHYALAVRRLLKSFELYNNGESGTLLLKKAKSIPGTTEKYQRIVLRRSSDGMVEAHDTVVPLSYETHVENEWVYYIELDRSNPFDAAAAQLMDDCFDTI
ncbi:hypothetical protein BJ085DRAFT_32833 [Dimargaris cristalligena]|uniref:Uncharacterized protein n=1 Tax=Dimargaris cristalligena TaxID=215637 RepID=A0A4P9ZTW8_9FUNG|nr:hypothetical protein BJ085DRAFT_32833 [Dimargaris cristalligena]|eukprot:RKP36957.1 hypothetical protein BJ085DRAFT_32833 [Dimargaris cristalligena]